MQLLYILIRMTRPIYSFLLNQPSKQKAVREGALPGAECEHATHGCLPISH